MDEYSAEMKAELAKVEATMRRGKIPKGLGGAYGGGVGPQTGKHGKNQASKKTKRKKKM